MNKFYFIFLVLMSLHLISDLKAEEFRQTGDEVILLQAGDEFGYPKSIIDDLISQCDNKMLEYRKDYKKNNPNGSGFFSNQIDMISENKAYCKIIGHPGF